LYTSRISHARSYGRHLPLGVPLERRHVLDAELFRDVLDHRPRHIKRIVWQEPPDEAHRAHLESEAELR
jgi:hypothetical protein